MKETLKIVDNVVEFKQHKKIKELGEEEQVEIINLYTWQTLNNFLDLFGKDNKIEGGIVILKTTDGDVRFECGAMNRDEIISTLEEVKQRHFYNKFFNKD